MVQEYKVKREDLDKILNKLGELPYKYGKVINDIVQEINNSFVEIKEEAKESYPPEDNEESQDETETNF